MGSQGEISVIYGVQVEAKVEWEAGVEQNPVVYSINGHTLCDDEDFMGGEDPDDGEALIAAGCPPRIEYFNGTIGDEYGAADTGKTTLSMAILGHRGANDAHPTGARHFGKGDGSKLGVVGKAIVGYVVCSECYLSMASQCPPMDEIKAQDARLVQDIQAQLGLTVAPNDLRLFLYFESLNLF